MITWEEIKPYCWYILGIAGVIFFWAGVWDGVGYLPFLVNPALSLAIGLMMLTLSPFIFPDRPPLWGQPKELEMKLHNINNHPLKHEFHIHYWDSQLKKELKFQASQLDQIEKGFAVCIDKTGKELFVPLHRITQIMHKNEMHWKGKS